MFISRFQVEKLGVAAITIVNTTNENSTRLNASLRCASLSARTPPGSHRPNKRTYGRMLALRSETGKPVHRSIGRTRTVCAAVFRLYQQKE